MATNNTVITTNVDPAITVTQGQVLDPSLVASTATVNTKVDPLLNTVQTIIVTTANPTAPAVANTVNTGTLTQTNIINSAVQNFLDTYQGNIGNVYHADVATFANNVPYTGITGLPDFSHVAFSGSFNDLLDLPPQFNLTGIATEAYVNQTISNVIGSAPAALNTLNELATALGNDAHFSTTLTNTLANKANISDLPNLVPYATTVYVDNKTTWANVTGKPTIPTRTSNLINDNAFITASSLSSYALNANIPSRVSNLINDTGFITSSSLTGYALTSSIPSRVGQLTNDSGFITTTSLGNYTFVGNTIQNNNNDPITLNTGADNWVFKTDGNLTLPRNTSTINYANGRNIIPVPTLDTTTNIDTGIMLYDGNLKYSSRVTVNPSNGDLKTPGNVTVRGSLTVLGSVSQVQQTTLNISSHEIVLNDGTTGIPTFDAKLVVNRGSSANTMLRWNEIDKVWDQTRNGSTYYKLPINTTELAEGDNLYYTDARANTAFDARLVTKTTTNIVEGANLYYTDARANTAFDIKLATKTTSNVAEGANLYFTNARARTAISVTGSGTYDAATGVITVTGGVTSVNSKTGTVSLNSDDITEATTNKYYTVARANTAIDYRLATKTTDDLAEGSSNLYYTDSRVETVFDNKLATKTTDDIDEGSINLYYTDDRANTAIYYVMPSYTGNISAGNASLGNSVTASYITVSSNLTTGNANLGNSVVANYITISANVTSGNANLGNLATANYLTVSGNITAGNTNLGNIATANYLTVASTLTVSNVTVNGKVNGSIIPSDNSIYDLGSDTNRWRDLYLSGSSIKLGTQSITTNANGLSIGNLTTANIVSTGSLNISGNLSVSNITLTGTINGSAIVSSGDLSATGDITGATATITGNVSGSNIVASSNVYGGNVSVTGIVNSGSIAAIGNVTGGNTIMSGTVSASGNVSGANVIAVVGITAGGNITGSNFITIGNVFAGNLSLTGGVQATSSITAAGLVSTTTISATGNVGGGNIVTSGALVGTALSVSGNITSLNANLGNATISSYFIGNGSLLTSLPGANITGQVGNAFIAGIVYTNAQPNITSVGTLTSLSVSGNIVSGNANLGNLIYANYHSGNGSLLSAITGSNVTGNVTTANSAGTAYYANIANSVTWTNISSKPSTISGFGITDAYSNTNLQNYLSLNPPTGTYSNSTVASYLPTFNGNLNAGNANLGNLLIANYHSGNGSLLSSITGANVTGNVTNANSAGSSYYSNVANSVTWTNISSKPTTLTGYGITDAYGNSNVISYLTANPQQGLYNDSNVAIYLPTFTGNIKSGNANLGNVAVATYFTGTLTTAAQPNITSLGNLTTLVVANLAANTVFGPGSINATGIIQAANFVGNATGLYSIPSANISGTVANANYSTYAGTVTTNAQPNITSVGSLSSLTIALNSNIVMSGTLSQISGGNLVSATNISGNIITAAQPSITSVGTLTTLTSGTHTISANSNIVMSGSLSQISGGNLVNATYLGGTLTTASQPNITSLGSLTSLTVTGNVTGGNLVTTGVANVGTVAATGNVVGGNLTTSGTVTGGSITTAGNLTVTNTLNSTGTGTGAFIVQGGGSVTKDFYVGGNLYVPNLITTTSTTLNVTTPLLYLGSNPSYPYNYTIGFYSNFALTSGTSYPANGYQHTGLVRNQADSAWYLFSNGAEPSGTLVDLANANLVFDTLKLGNITLTNTGNANLGNLVKSNYFSGNASLLFSMNGANITGQVANSLIAGTVTTAAQPNITSVGSLTSLTMAANGNIAMSGSLSNITGVNAVSASYFIGNGSLLTGLPASYSNTNVQNYLPTYTGNLAGGNINLTYATTSTANLGNAVSANYFIGNGSLLTGLPASYANSNVAAYLPTFTGNVTAGNVNITGQFISTVATGSAPISVASTTRVSNLNVAYSNVSDYGAVTTQSTGTFYPVFVSGNTTGNYALASNTNMSFNAATGALNVGNIISGVGTGGNITGANLISANYFTGTNLISSNLISANYYTAASLITVSSNGNIALSGSLSQISGANLVSATYLGGTLTTAAQPNITSVGSLTSLTTGTVTVTANSNIAMSGTLSQVSGANLVSATNLSGNLITAAQTNITSVGSLTSLTTGTVTVTANSNIAMSGSLSQISGVNSISTTYLTTGSNGNIAMSGSLSQISGGNLVSATYLGGTLTTAAQPNITSVGSLTSLTTGTHTLNANSNIVMSGTLSNISGVNAVSASYFIGNGSLLTGLPAGYANSNVAAYLPTYTGNITGGNINLTYATTSTANLGNAVIANYIIGNGSLLTGLPAGYANSNVALYLPTYTGNITAGNANITGQFISTASTGTAPLTVSSTTRVTNLNVSYSNVSDYGVVTAQTSGTFYPVFVSGSTTGNYAMASNANISFNAATGALTANSVVAGTGIGGTITGANLVYANYVTAANVITATYFSGKLDTLSNSQPNITSVGTLTTLTSGTHTLNANSNIVMSGTLSNISGVNTVSASYFIGNGSQLTGLPPSYTNTNTSSYLTSSSATGISLAANGNITLSGSLSTISGANLITATYITAGSGTGGIISGANVISANYINATNVLTLLGNGNIAMSGTLSQVSGANLVSATYLGGTLTTAAQPNITSVGSLTTLTSGTHTLNANSNIVMSGTLSQVSGANLVSATYLGGTLTTAAQTSITSVGSLTSLTTGTVTVTANSNIAMSGTSSQISGVNLVSATNMVVGNSTANATFTNGGNIAFTSYGTISGGNLVSATYLSGTLTTAAQTSITSVGTLTGLTMVGGGNITLSGSTSQISGANLVSASFISGNGYLLTGLPASYSNTNASLYLASGSQTATVNIAALTASGAVGAQANLTVGGWLTSQQSTEVLTNLGTLASTPVTCNLMLGGTFYFSGITTGSNFTINFTNVPTTTERTIVATVMLAQSATAYIPSAVQIDGAAQTIKWLGGTTPFGTSTGVDTFTFALVRTGSAWAQVLGAASGFA